jgi:hypothetical protein
MPVTAYHQLTATTPDDPAYEIRPSHFNQSHLVTIAAAGSEISGAFSNGGGVTFGLETNGFITASAPAGGGGLTNINISAGTTSNNLSAVTFSNGSGVSFGLNGSVITASVQTNYLTTARASNDAVGLNTALTAGPLAMTVNSSGISINAGSAAGTTSGFGGNLISGSMTHNTAGLNLSLNHPAWLTTAMQSNAVTLSNIRVSGGTTSNLLSAITFSNSNGVSFGLNAGTMTASHNGLTTARASNDGVGLNTAVTNVTATINSAGISINAAGYAGTNTTFNGANISGSMTVNSNGVQLSMSAAAPGGGGAINVTAGTTSGNLQTIQFDNANGVTFGLDGSTVTASVAAGGGGGPSIAAGGATATNGTVIFSNSNNITFGLNGSTMTASYADVTESIFWRPNDIITTVGAPINASASIIYCPMDHNLSASRFDLIASVNVATAANNSSAGFLYSATAVIYTLNGATLSSLSSTTTNNQMTWTSNATGSVTGAFFLSLPLAVSAAADKYWVGVQLSTRATGLTGAATTSLANTVTMMGIGSAVYGAFSAREPGSATANSNGWLKGLGMYSGTTNFSTIGLTNLTQQGTNANRANVAFRMLNV